MTSTVLFLMLRIILKVRGLVSDMGIVFSLAIGACIRLFNEEGSGAPLPAQVHCLYAAVLLLSTESGVG
jgi:hypothetical protein